MSAMSSLSSHSYHTSSSNSDDWFGVDPRIDVYRPGGFHPIDCGDSLLDGRYIIKDKLGQGGFGEIWLAHDCQDKKFVAIKVMAAKVKDDSEFRMINQLHSVGQHDYIPAVLNHFIIQGPNGNHQSIVMEIARMSLREYLGHNKRERVLQLPVIKAMVWQLVQAVAYLHSAGIAHGDLHAGNVLIHRSRPFDETELALLQEDHESREFPTSTFGSWTSTPEFPKNIIDSVSVSGDISSLSVDDARLFLSDFGEAFFPADGDHVKSACILSSSAPETFMDEPLSFPIDIWSLALLIFVICSSGTPAVSCKGSWAATQCLMVDWIDAFGKLPDQLFKKWYPSLRVFCDTEGSVKEEKRSHASESFALRCSKIQQEREQADMPQMSETEHQAFYALLKNMLVYDPQQRATIDQVLNSEWIRKWVLSDNTANDNGLFFLARDLDEHEKRELETGSITAKNVFPIPDVATMEFKDFPIEALPSVESTAILESYQDRGSAVTAEDESVYGSMLTDKYKDHAYNSACLGNSSINKHWINWKSVIPRLLSQEHSSIESSVAPTSSEANTPSGSTTSTVSIRSSGATAETQPSEVSGNVVHVWPHLPSAKEQEETLSCCGSQSSNNSTHAANSGKSFDSKTQFADVINSSEHEHVAEVDSSEYNHAPDLIEHILGSMPQVDQLTTVQRASNKSISGFLDSDPTIIDHENPLDSIGRDYLRKRDCFYAPFQRIGHAVFKKHEDRTYEENKNNLTGSHDQGEEILIGEPELLSEPEVVPESEALPDQEPPHKPLLRNSDCFLNPLKSLGHQLKKAAKKVANAASPCKF